MIWSIFWAIFQSFCNHEIFVKFNLPIFLVVARQRAKLFFDPSTFN